MHFADSFVAGALFPLVGREYVIQAVFETWGTCKAKALSEEFKLACKAGTLLPEDQYIDAMRQHRDVRFVMVNSKVDWQQVRYNSAIIRMQMAPEVFYKQASVFLKKYALEPNFRSYLVDGDHHIYARSEQVFTATPKGADGGGTGPKLIDWLFNASKCSHSVPGNVCEGRPIDVAHAAAAPTPPDYCDPALSGEGA